MILAEILNSCCKNPNLRYGLAVFGLRFNLCLKLLKCPFIFNRFLRKWVMKSGLKSLKGKNLTL